MALLATLTSFPGVFGNLLAVTVLFQEGGPNLVITVANDTGITLTLGTTGGVQNIGWDQVAILFNASPESSLATMVGQVTGGVPLAAEVDGGGSAGLGLGQYYTAPTTPPPVPCTSVQSMVTLAGNPAPSYAGAATPETANPIISQL